MQKQIYIILFTYLYQDEKALQKLELYLTKCKYMYTWIIIRANGLGTPIGSSEGGGWIGGNGWLASPLTY